MPAPLTLPEFRLARRTLPLDRLADALGDTGETFHDDATSGLLYDKHLFVLRLSDGAFWTMIGRTEIDGTLPEVEARLYFNWYASESATGWTLDGLYALLGQFCDFYNLPVVSADEIEGEAAMPLTSGQREFLGWFMEVWFEAQDRADLAEREATFRRNPEHAEG